MQTNKLSNRITRRQALLAAATISSWSLVRCTSRAAERPRYDDAIDAAWQAGLDALKPSAAELDRGLKLHQESLVFDCYGFSPRCAVDGDAIAKAVTQGASDEELLDLKEDQSMTRCVGNAAERAEFEIAWQAAGVTCIFQNAGEEGNDPLRLLKRLGDSPTSPITCEIFSPRRLARQISNPPSGLGSTPCISAATAYDSLANSIPRLTSCGTCGSAINWAFA